MGTDFTDDPNPLYERDKILKFHDLVKLKNILFCYDFWHNPLPVCSSEGFIKEYKKGCLLVPKRNSTEYGSHLIFHKIILTWNSFTATLECNFPELSRSALA